ncbi:MAG: V-type ATP synthase subunit A [Thermofilum sp. ex4484_82]|nr:MAG: V-type ATP synthase subunit A [Thermofilum sp. ex4484_82]OYT36280.1 MAG: V-type ATP synthase subunit A [Archaeoglobales archaeon ex4484_92]
MPVKGKIVWISGPVVKAEGMAKSQMYEMVEVGSEGLIGEIIRLEGNIAYIQVYEDTTGLKPGETVIGTGKPLSVELGPGLLASIYDGIQRPLSIIARKIGPFIKRGVKIDAIPKDKKWHFRPVIKKGEKVGPGDVIGVVKETELIEHKIMVPPRQEPGRIKEIAPEGDYTVIEPIAFLEIDGVEKTLTMMQYWPVRFPRPSCRRVHSKIPLITGTRIIDVLFPIVKGGTACIPGGFGTGKTVMLHQIASWSDANVVIYVGCGERGNEMTEILIKFPKLKDPYSGKPLLYRTIMIANTSNMPVAAREASIYTGITMAEYYRDMGYDVLLVADSTSRWAEALREVSGRLEEMPAEEGYPSYLASKIAEFYERAGRVECLGRPDRYGSVTVIGAVSPPGGDFTEPVTTHTLRFTKVFWGLDTALAYSRHYPAINWIISYSAYIDDVEDWWKKTDPDWRKYREKALSILHKEDELKEIVRLLGPEALPPHEKLILLTARMLREGYLQQDAFNPVDSYSISLKQIKLLKLIMTFHEVAEKLLEEGVPFENIGSLRLVFDIIRLKERVTNEEIHIIDEWIKRVENLPLELKAKATV